MLGSFCRDLLMPRNTRPAADESSSGNVVCPYCWRSFLRSLYVEHAKDQHPWNIYLLDDGVPRNPIEISSKKQRGAQPVDGAGLFGAVDAADGWD